MRVLILLFMFFQLHCIGQKLPIDSTFYKDGSIKTIRYNNMLLLTGAYKEYYKKSENLLDINQPLSDSACRKERILIKSRTSSDKIYKDSINCSRYEGENRIYFDGISSVTITKFEYANPGYKSIEGRYSFLFPDIFFLEFDLWYNSDTTIEGINVYIHDTSKCCDLFKELFYRVSLKSARFYNKGIGKENLFQCGKYGTLTLVFDEKNFLKKIYFLNNDNIEKYYELDNRFFCVNTGYFKNRLQINEWKEYYSNGNLSTIGHYEIKDSNGLQTSVKDGVWRYFNQNGSLLKMESYMNGMVIK